METAAKEEGLKETIDKISAEITSAGGKVETVQKMDKRSFARVGGATFLGAFQFFLITNFGVWAFLSSYPRTAAGLATCYLAGVPFFWNTLAGDAIYATLLFGGFFLAERLAPRLRLSSVSNLDARH